MDVSAVYIDLFYGLSFKGYAETEHPVCRRMLWTYVYHIFLVIEQRMPLQDVAAVGGHLIARGHVFIPLVFHVQGIQGHVIVLAQRVAFPVVPEEEPPEVRMADELDAEEVVCLPFIEVRPFPQVMHGWKTRIFPVRVGRAEHDVLSGGCILQMVYASEPVFPPVNACQAAEEVESIIVKLFRKAPE